MCKSTQGYEGSRTFRVSHQHMHICCLSWLPSPCTFVQWVQITVHFCALWDQDSRCRAGQILSMRAIQCA